MTRELTTKELDKLIELSIKAKDKAYCPYSKFRVGAALLDEDGNWHTGANIENASYGGAICAERTVFIKAISEGQRKFVALGVSTDTRQYARPCGICRQFMIEFEDILPIYLIQPDRSYQIVILKDLLPDSFGPEILKLSRVTENKSP